MSLTDARKIEELSPSRLAIVLFVDCFDAFPALRSAPQFWRCAAPYANDARRAPGLFAELLARGPAADALRACVPALAQRLLDTDALELTVRSVAQRVHDGSLGVRPRSFVGCLCGDQAALLDMLDIYGAVAVWRNLLAEFAPFARALGHELPAQSAQLLQTCVAAREPAPRAAAGYRGGQDPLQCLEARDVEATLDSFYRALDRRGQPPAVAGGGAAPPSRAHTQQLAIIFESLGHADAALEAQSQAFASERRRIIVESKDAPRPLRGDSLVQTRGMVSWLHHVLAAHPTARVPQELALGLDDIQDYLRHTATTPDERADVASMQLRHALDTGSGSAALRASALGMIEVYASHSQARNAAARSCAFHTLLAVLWFRLGKRHAAHSHAAQALACAQQCREAPLRSHLFCELAFCHGFEFGDLAAGVRVLARAADAPRFDEGAVYTRTLLFAGLFLRAHDFAAAQNLLDEAEDALLNKLQLRAKRALQQQLLAATGEHYAAHVFAAQGVSELPDDERRGYAALRTRLAGARALVQSRDALNAIEARGFLSDCLRRARQLGYANLALEAALLEARVCYNARDYAACRRLCEVLQQDASATPQRALYCEWLLLHAASAQLAAGECLRVDAAPFRDALYTEFGDLSAVPRLAALCLRPRAAVARPWQVPARNALAQALVAALDGSLDMSSLPAAAAAAYEAFVAELNEGSAAPSTPGTPGTPEAGRSDVRIDRCSLIAPAPGPAGDDDDWASPPPRIRLDADASGAASPDAAAAPEGISVPKRLRPLGASPLKGRKRRSTTLEPEEA